MGPSQSLLSPPLWGMGNLLCLILSIPPWDSLRPLAPAASSRSPARLLRRNGDHCHSAHSAHRSCRMKCDRGLCQELKAASQFCLHFLCFIFPVSVNWE